jgi:hypothetical protein
VDKAEARALLDEFLQELKARSYRELQGFISNPVCFERVGPSGVAYQIEYEAVWDAQPGGVLRIIASIDDGGLLSAMMPVSSGFLITQEGKVI